MYRIYDEVTEVAKARLVWEVNQIQKLSIIMGYAENE